MTPKERAAKIADEARKLTAKGSESDFKTGAEVVQEIMSTAETVESYGLSSEQFISAKAPTGLQWIDDAIGGYPLPSLSLIAARSGIGKSAAVTASAITLCRNGKSAAVFSFEMSRRQYITRFVASLSGVNSRKIDEGRLTDDDYSKVVEAFDEITKWGKKLRIHDLSAPKPERMLSLIEASVADGAEYIFIDHVGLVGDPSKGRYEAQSAVADVCLAAKQRCQVPIIALVQFNRLNDRESRPPRLSDLRDSGKWEENADVVISIHRPAQQIARDDPEMMKFLKNNVAEPEPVQWAILKNRFGETSVVDSEFFRPLAQFRPGRGNDYLRSECGL
jgi:replicative DNA helicase